MNPPPRDVAERLLWGLDGGEVREVREMPRRTDTTTRNRTNKAQRTGTSRRRKSQLENKNSFLNNRETCDDSHGCPRVIAVGSCVCVHDTYCTGKEGLQALESSI